tara:strand:+ start:1005 stop:1595 length:591 start_codon:yes stop_codon:yes gene_type:complete
MKQVKTFTLVAFMGMMAFATTSCKKNKEVTETPKGEVLVDVYCSGPEYFTNKEYFRANAIGESLDQMTAKKKALSNARSQMAADLEVTMKVVGDNYVKSSEFNNKEEVTETFQENARTVVNQVLQGTRTICEKQTKTVEGKYKTYIAIELSADELLQKYSERLSADESLKADYNYEKFKETFDAEMQKLENERSGM